MTAGARTIVFDVSGTIDVSSSLSTAYGNVTIAGQTAPVGGITFTGNVGNNPIFGVSGRDNMIFRYIRVRPTFQLSSGNADAMQFWECTNIILDHVSTSWGGDECVDFGATDDPMYNITLQNSIITESKTGSILGASNNPALSYDLSALGNLFIETDHRIPNTISNLRLDHINNVIWGNGYRLNRPAPSSPQLNEINNYYRSGTARNLFDMNKIDFYGTVPQIYSKGNLHLPTTVTDPDLANNNNTRSAFGWPDKSFSFTNNAVNYYDDAAASAALFTGSQHTLVGDVWPIMTALESLEHAKTNVGANKLLDCSGNIVVDIDGIDTRYMADLNDGIALDMPYPFTMVGKTHYTDFLATISRTPINSRPTGYDSDGNGMPDAWEISRGFDPNKIDNNEDPDGNGYTNLEEFLNLVDF